MILRIVRRKPQPEGRFSDWTIDGELFCVGVENPDTLIPCGIYELRPHNSCKACLKKYHGETVAFHNPELGVFCEKYMITKLGSRYDCLIHPGNWSIQLEGCAAPGSMVTGVRPHGVGVINSQDTFEKLVARWGDRTGLQAIITEAP